MSDDSHWIFDYPHNFVVTFEFFAYPLLFNTRKTVLCFVLTVRKYFLTSGLQIVFELIFKLQTVVLNVDQLIKSLITQNHICQIDCLKILRRVFSGWSWRVSKNSLILLWLGFVIFESLIILVSKQIFISDSIKIVINNSSIHCSGYFPCSLPECCVLVGPNN